MRLWVKCGSLSEVAVTSWSDIFLPGLVGQPGQFSQQWLKDINPSGTT